MTLTEENETPLERTLSSLMRKRESSPVNSLAYALLARGMADGHSAETVRKTVLRVSRRDDLRGFFESTGGFNAAAKAAAEFVALGRTDAGRRGKILHDARAMVAHVLTPNRVQGMTDRGEVAARNTLAVVGGLVLESIATTGMSTAVVSASKLEAVLGRRRESIAEDMSWAIRAGHLRKVGTAKSRAGRYAIRRLDDVQGNAIRGMSDVVDAVAASSVVGQLVESVSSIDPTNFADLDLSDIIIDETPTNDDEQFMADLRDWRKRRREASFPTGGRANPFGPILTGLWLPCGMLEGLDPALAAGAVADAILSADSIIWRSQINGGTLTLSDWTYLIESSAGFEFGSLGTVLKSANENRLRRLVPNLVERLNSGERLATILTESETDWGRMKADERLAAWQESSTAWKTVRTENSEFFEQGQENVEALLKVTGPIPAADKDERERELWLREGAHKISMRWGVLDADTRTYTAAALGSRLKRRGYSADAIEVIAQSLLPVA